MAENLKGLVAIGGITSITEQIREGNVKPPVTATLIFNGKGSVLLEFGPDGNVTEPPKIVFDPSDPEHAYVEIKFKVRASDDVSINAGRQGDGRSYFLTRNFDA